MSVLVLILLKIAPIFLVLLLGYAAFALRWVDAGFVGSANRLVFNAAMPALVFLSISGADFGGSFPWREIIAFSIAMVATLAAAYAVGGSLKLPGPQRASFIQGALRGNFAIIGLAIVEQIIGADWLPNAAVLIAFFLPIHNFASIVVLSSLSEEAGEHLHPLRRAGVIILKSLQNPLIGAIVLGILVSLLKLHLPEVLVTALTYLRRLALPLALIGIGGSVGSYHAGGHYPLALGSSVLKLLFMPLLAILVALLLGLRGEELIILAIFSGAPTAVGSYSISDAMGGDRDTAGSIIVVSTAICFLSTTLILTVLRLTGFT